MSTPIAELSWGSGEDTASHVGSPVVGIGLASGGIEALEALGASLHCEDLALVVAHHLSAAEEPGLHTALAAAAHVKVVTARDGETLTRNCAYLAPAGAELTLHGDALKLTPSARPPRWSIDVLFRSLAAQAGPKAVGVLLSGLGSDGALGLRAIREAGGLTLVQSPSTALHPSMPQCAVEAGCADAVLSPVDLAHELARVTAYPYIGPQRALQPLEQAALLAMTGLLKRRTGVDFSSLRGGVVERRVARRMAVQKMTRSDDYLMLLERCPPEVAALASEVLGGGAGFFHRAEALEACLPRVFPGGGPEPAPQEPLRVWVAGAGTGEEAYSVAMLLLEVLGERQKLQVFATELDEAALKQARSGVYPLNIELDVTPARLGRFFLRGERSYQILRTVRERVIFARHDLDTMPPFSNMDLIVCRQALAGLQPRFMRKALRSFHFALKPTGHLLLGPLEPSSEEHELFTAADRRARLFAKKDIASPAVYDFAFSARSDGPRHAPRRPSLQQLADRKVLEAFSPAGLIVDERLVVLQFRGRTSPYLVISSGTPTLNLLKLVRPELVGEVRAAAQRALESSLPASSPATLLDSGTAVAVEVVPLVDPGQPLALLVLFRAHPASDALPARELPLSTSSPETAELERELTVTREYLRTTVNELEGTTEDLQRSNEELVSANEELHTINEELECSREELQSANTELLSVNTELKARVAELTQLEEDLNCVMGGVDSAVIVVGRDLGVRRLSEAARKRVGHCMPDRGLEQLARVVGLPGLAGAVQLALQSGVSTEHPIGDLNGQRHRLRISAVRRQTGAHFALLELLQGDEEGVALAPLLAALPHAVLVVDAAMRLVWGNPESLKLVGNTAVGRPLFEAWRPLESEALLERVQAVAVGGEPVEGAKAKDALGALRLSARRVASEHGAPPLTMVLVERAGAWGERVTVRLPPLMEDAGGPRADELQHRLRAVERRNRELEEALQSSEEARGRYADLYDFAPVACCTLDAHGRIEAANLTCATLFGRERGDILGLPFSALVRLEHPEAFFAHLTLCRSTGRPTVSELAFDTYSGRFEVQLVSVPVLEPRGPAASLRTAIVDISERKRAEAERSAAFEAEQRLRAQIETVGRAAVAVNRALAVTPHSSTADVLSVLLHEVRALTGARGAAFCRVDQHDAWVFSGLSRPGDAALLARCEAATPPVLERDLVGVKVGYGDRTLGNLFVADKEGGHPFTPDDRTMLDELAERVGISLEISRLNQSAHDAVRSRDVLLAVVAHDLRSPLSAISVSSAIFARKAPADGDRRRGQKQVSIIKKATERMDRLIEDLLTASTIEAGRFTVCLQAEPVAAIFEEAHELLEPAAAAAQVSLEHDPAGELPPVLCDRERVIQVLGNLVQNAVKFTPSGGHVRMWAGLEDGGLRLSVSDDGPGIAPAKVPLLFDRYWKGESSGRHGVGLGLYISRGIIESHGTRLQVETEVGRGSTFSFTLPLAPKGSA